MLTFFGLQLLIYKIANKRNSERPSISVPSFHSYPHVGSAAYTSTD